MRWKCGKSQSFIKSTQFSRLFSAISSSYPWTWKSANSTQKKLCIWAFTKTSQLLSLAIGMLYCWYLQVLGRWSVGEMSVDWKIHVRRVVAVFRVSRWNYLQLFKIIWIDLCNKTYFRQNNFFTQIFCLLLNSYQSIILPDYKITYSCLRGIQLK